jgi:hypothetical protein
VKLPGRCRGPAVLRAGRPKDLERIAELEALRQETPPDGWSCGCEAKTSGHDVVDSPDQVRRDDISKTDVHRAI